MAPTRRLFCNDGLATDLVMASYYPNGLEFAEEAFEKYFRNELVRETVKGEFSKAVEYTFIPKSNIKIIF